MSEGSLIKHKHHIVPKHMGGTNDACNLVELTVEEHAEVHRILFEQNGHWQDEVAWKALSGQITCAEAIKQAQKNYMSNRIVSQGTRDKMAKATRERIHTKGHPLQGKKHSEESKRKMSESHKGQIPINKGKKCSKEQIERNRQIQLNLPSIPCLICHKLIKNPGNMKQHMRKHKKEI